MADSVVGRLIYMITGDSSALVSSLDKSRTKITQTGESLERLSSKMKTMASTVISGYLVKSLIEASSRVEELSNKFDTVFSGMETVADSWARKYADATSRGVTATKEFLASQQDIRTGYGDSVEQAMLFSQAVVGVTNDLASFSNLPIEEAMQVISSGLSQQFEALRRVGVGLNVQIINQGAYAKALGKTWEQMNNLERQEAILSGIVSQSKNALHQELQLWQEYDYTLGDAALTSKSFANSSQGLRQSFDDMKAELGDALLPMITDVISVALSAVKAFNKWDDATQSLSTALLAFGAVMIGIGGPVGLVLGSLAALTIVISNNQTGIEDLTQASKDLKRASDEYNTVLQTLNGNTEGLTRSELALLEARKNILKLQMTTSMNELGENYKTVTDQIEEQTAAVSAAEQKLKALEIAQEALNTGDMKQLGMHLTAKINLEMAGKLDTNPNRVFYETLEMANLNIQEVLADGAEYVKGQQEAFAQAIIETNGDLIKANGDLAESELPVKESILTVARAYNQGLIDLKAYESAYPELTKQIKDAAAEMATEEEEISGSSSVVEKAISLGRAWQDQRKAQQADLLEEQGNYKEAVLLRLDMLETERDADNKNLAIKAGIIKEEEELTDELLAENLKSNEDFAAEYYALNLFYEDEAVRIAKEANDKKIASDKKMADKRKDNADEWIEKLKSQSDSARQAAADELEANGDIEGAYKLRLEMLNEEHNATKTALEEKVKAKEATETDLANLDLYYANEAIRIENEKSDALKTADEELANKRNDNAEEWIEKLKSQSDSARQAAADELEASGDIEGAYLIRRQLLEEEAKAAKSSLQERIDAGEATYSEMTNLEKVYANEIEDIEKEKQDKVIQSEKEAYEQRKRSFKEFISNTISETKNLGSAIVDLTSAYTNRQIEQIDRETQAKLEALGIAEKSKSQALQEEYNEAVKNGDMKLAKEKADEIARLQIEEEANKQKAELQKQQAEKERGLRIFNSTIDMLSAIVRYLVDPGGLAGVGLSAMAAATGAMQIAAIKAEPLPSFSVGANYVPEDMLAVIHQGETILPAPMAESVRRGDAVFGEGGLQLNVIIENHSQEKVDVSTSGEGDEKQMKIVIGQVVDQQITTGRFDSSLGSRYGLARRGRNA